MRTNIEESDNNIIAGRDAYILRAQKGTVEKLQEFPDIFRNVDDAFAAILGKEYIQRWGNEEVFSSEKLFASLVTIGIPVFVAITVPNRILPLLQSFKEHSDVEIFDGNTIKKCVLEVITGLQFMEPFASQDEVSTWSSAYVRRYGNANEFIHVLDNGFPRELDHEFVKEVFIPHILEKALGLRRGTDVLATYKGAFSGPVIDRMAREIIRIANGLNVYEIEYRTLFRLITEVMIKPPHPWIVNPTTQKSVVLYNLEKAQEHLDEISSKVAEKDPQQAVPSALECAAHSCAAILARYGLLLGVESRYGLDELIRVCNIKIAQRNLVLWDFCELELFEQNLQAEGMTVKSLASFLNRLAITLRSSKKSDDDLRAVFNYCAELKKITDHLVK